MLDVLTLGLAAGLSFDASLELYCEPYDGELSRALLESMLAWRMGIRSREAELARLADELGVPAFRRFASVVGESLSFGTPLAEALERQGEAIDEQRSQVEEEIGAGAGEDARAPGDAHCPGDARCYPWAASGPGAGCWMTLL